MFCKIFLRSFKTYSVLKPFMDFEARLANLPTIKDNVSRRELNLNVDEVVALYRNWKELEKVKSGLEESREAVRLKLANSGSNKDENDERQLKIMAKILREDHKQIKSAAGDLEQRLAALMMAMPNDLSPRTPLEDEIVFEKLMPQSARGSHLEIGQNLDVIEVKSPWAIFLKDRAAQFELEIVQKLESVLSKRGFFGFSNPDFVREIVTEGCQGVYGSGLALSPFKDGDDGDDGSFLTGGAAPEPFFAFFAKNVVKSSDLPLRCFATGRRYGPCGDFGLFDPPQTDAVQVFVAVPPATEAEELEGLVDVVSAFYDGLVSHRLVVKGARCLEVAESLRFSFEVFSPHWDKFFEVGHVSLYGDHLSKNMNFRVTGGASNDFVRVISGTVLRVGPLLASIIETDGKLKSIE